MDVLLEITTSGITAWTAPFHCWLLFLQDSPVGLAAWITEKFKTWSDCGSRPDNAISKDELLTNICIYWFGGRIASSMRLYKEFQQGGWVVGGSLQLQLPCSAESRCWLLVAAVQCAVACTRQATQLQVTPRQLLRMQ
jgi:hypothetical protein